MGSNLSVAQIIDDLEAQIAQHKAQVDLHTAQEVFHAERKAHHTAELEKLSACLEDFRRTSSAVLEVTASRQNVKDDQRQLGSRPRFSRLIDAILEDKAGDETFSATSLAREIQQRFGGRVEKARRVEPRSIASQLRRMAFRGEVHVAREGRAHHEALYSRNRPRG